MVVMKVVMKVIMKVVMKVVIKVVMVEVQKPAVSLEEGLGPEFERSRV